MSKYPLTTPPVPPGNVRPEFYRLPPRGPDPYFGITRPHYYRLEAAGEIKLVRIKEPGKTRGIVLVPYEMMNSYVRTKMTEQHRAARQTHEISNYV